MFTFERAIPEITNVSSKDIQKLLFVLDKKRVPMHSLLIMKDEKLIFEKYYAPYTEKALHRLFSISKSFTAMAIALMCQEGRISLDDPITMHFPEYTDENTHPWIKQTTIRNMLQMRTCHASTTYKFDMNSDWVESFFKVPPTHKPGTVFHYDTSAAHTMCALVEKYSGMPLLEYLKVKALNYLDFSADSYMLKDPFGVSIGGSGVMATPMDFLKFLYLVSKEGTVVCNDGVTRALLPKEFVKEATSNISDTMASMPLPSESQGYGMQIWQNEKGGFVMYGMGGQLGISIPSENLLIVTTADTQGMPGGNQVIYDAVYDCLLGSSATDDGEKSYGELMDYAKTLEIAPPRLPENYVINGIGGSVASSGLIGIRRYDLDENPAGFKSLELEISDTKASYLRLTTDSDTLELRFGIDKMAEGVFPRYDCPYTAGAVFLRDNVLYIRFHLIGESVGSVHFELYFGECDVTIFMRKVEETMYKEFDGHLYGRESSV